MLVITGAAGFIGSVLSARFLEEGQNDILLVDDFSIAEKEANHKNKAGVSKMHRDVFTNWLKENHGTVSYIIHIGARTDTAEFDYALLNRLNLDYTKAIWHECTAHGIPLIYASSAATYGDGALGYDDNHALPYELKPLNPYGESKNDFDKWALQQADCPPFWAGLKFFNVYGPNEYHKGRMASVILHAFKQISATGKMKLFRSHNPNYKDGEQMRDFVYVKDVVKVIHFLYRNGKAENSGLYNLGTGKAETFRTLAESVFEALDKNPDITFIDTPEDIRDKYQYFTEANMQKLRDIGYDEPFTSLKEGAKDYVQNYLLSKAYL